MSRGNQARPARREQRSGRSGARTSAVRRSSFAALALLVLPLLLTGCRQKMANQPRYDPLEASDFFADGMAARPRVEGTVARGELSGDPIFETGMLAGKPVTRFPAQVTLDRALVDRGHERYDIYCSHCHGRLGDGNGMIPSRGLRRPPSLHTETLRNAPVGHFFDVMTNGFGAMPPYKTMVPPHDRWAIAAYIRALQLSQSARPADLPPGELAKLEAPPAAAAAPAHGGSH